MHDFAERRHNECININMMWLCPMELPNTLESALYITNNYFIRSSGRSIGTCSPFY